MFRSKKDALASIHSRERFVGGKHYTIFDAYLGVNPITKKQVRFYDADKVRLEETVKEFYRKIEKSGDLGVLLAPEQVMDAKMAISILEQAGMTCTLADCAREAVERMRATAAIPTKPLGEAYDEYYNSFGELQDRQRESVRYRIGNWVEATGRNRHVSSVTAAEIVSWLDSKFSASNKSWNNSMTYIKTFLTWCQNSLRRYVLDNPIAELKKKPIAWKEPEFVRPDVTKRIFSILRADTAHPNWLAYATLSYFCGVRRDEILRLANDPTAGSVNLEDETVRIAKPKGYQKGIRPRSFRIPPNALEWMRSFDFHRGLSKVNPHTTERMAAYLRKLGVELVDNPGRHTFITMHVAAYQDPAKTDAMTGTSAQMRANHYMGLASQKEGLAHFAIAPSNTPAADLTAATLPRV